MRLVIVVYFALQVWEDDVEEERPFNLFGTDERSLFSDGFRLSLSHHVLQILRYVGSPSQGVKVFRKHPSCRDHQSLSLAKRGEIKRERESSRERVQERDKEREI